MNKPILAHGYINPLITNDCDYLPAILLVMFIIDGIAGCVKEEEK
jgi:hypothetical protein